LTWGWGEGMLGGKPMKGGGFDFFLGEA
jgi:hypothetical protein